MSVVRYHASKITGFLVNRFGISLMGFLDESPLDPFLLECQYLWIWNFLPQLRKLATELVDKPPPESLSLTLCLISG